MENILVTGGAGFIGSHFIRYMLDEYKAVKLVNVDLLTYAGRWDNIADFEKDPNYHFIKADIRDYQKMKDIFLDYQIDTVVNFAAESHVDRSIQDSALFFSTNVLGTQSLLDAAIQSWKVNLLDNNDRTFHPNVTFLQVSTDEVYGSLPAEGLFTETTPLKPNSPYAASKASADMLVHAYHHTYGLPTKITRCSNNYGPNQFPEKFIPLMISKCLQGEPLPVYGDGQQVRDWLHVFDHCRGIERVLQKGRDGEVYNIGGNNEKSNLEILNHIIKTLNHVAAQVTFVADRPGHDRRYAIDHTKITRDLGWEPVIPFDQGLRETIAHYLKPVLG